MGMILHMCMFIYMHMSTLIIKLMDVLIILLFCLQLGIQYFISLMLLSLLSYEYINMLVNFITSDLSIINAMCCSSLNT